MAVPAQSEIAACNQSAATQAGQRDKTVDTVKDGAIGAVAGAALGAAGGAIAGGGRGAGKGAAIGGLVGAGGGTLYGLNENKKHDERYRDAYAACMRSHGYAG
jgi:outer membrane lipoprotein SlyB